MASWYELGKNHIWYPYTQMHMMDAPVKVASAQGSLLTLEDGSTLIDGIASWWSVSHGHGHPHIKEAIASQLDTLAHVMFAGTAHKQPYQLAQRLATLTGLAKVFFSDSGSTAIETAMKMAVQYWHNKGDKHRNKFISFENGYHGDTMGCMSLCDPHNGMHQAMNDYMPRQYAVPVPSDEYGFKEMDALFADIRHKVAAVIIEPLVQGAGGMRFHTADMLAEIHRLAKKHDLLFIADEVMTGFGRTGSMFACAEAGITPDITCLGKGLTGGFITLAATLTTQDIYDCFLSEKLETALMSGPTFMANPLACAAANASLDLFETEDRLAQVETIEAQLYQQLSPCRNLRGVVDVRVKGAIGVVQIDTSWDEIFKLRQQSIQKGVWLRPFKDVVYILPPLTISQDELTQLTSAVVDILQSRESKA